MVGKWGGAKKKTKPGDAVFWVAKKGGRNETDRLLCPNPIKVKRRQERKHRGFFFAEGNRCAGSGFGCRDRGNKAGQEKSKKRKSTLVLCSCPFVPFSYL